MSEVLASSFEDLELPLDDIELASPDDNSTKQTDSPHHGICDDCFKVPWENFGTSHDPASFTVREPFMSWKYIVPTGRTWPASPTCRICHFMRELLAGYGFGGTTSIRKLRGGWDGEKPFRMTFLELDQDEDDSFGSEHSEVEHDTACSDDDADVQSDGNEGDKSEQGSDGDAYTVWEDDDDAYHTFIIPSFFATSLEVDAFQFAMHGYKPTHVDFGIVRSWLDECSRAHSEKCHPRTRHYVRNLKVIDCAKRAIVPAPLDCLFVALSYVWGPPSAQPDLTSPAFSTPLPQTIEDSIFVTKELGFNYLWVDRYCIDQNNAAEKREQIEQMADIYASAAVTIIAAAGEDPSHGLSGIQSGSRGLCHHEQVRSVRLIANPCISPRDRYSPFYVHESKWASRAWTFQECYNSPRRLFFTDEQITLICNSAAYQETTGTVALRSSHPIHTNLRGWINAVVGGSMSKAVLDAVPYPLASVMDILNIYSQRQMSFDSDALNAIFGTLETFNRHDIQHLWGVPVWLPRCSIEMKQYSIITPDRMAEEQLCFRSRDEILDSNTATAVYTQLRVIASASKDSIALIWHNRSPCYRRAGFPSWSPLGWKEEFPWLARQGIGWSSRQTPPTSGNDLITLLAACTGIRTLPKFESIGARSYRETGYKTLGADTQHIWVLAPTINLRLALSPDGVTSDQYRDCVAIRVDDGLDVLLAATWDKRPWEMKNDIALKGLMLAVANSSVCCADSPHYAMIVMEQHGDYWERVAIALITNNFLVSTTEEDEVICSLTTAYPPLFRETSTGALFTWDQRRFNNRSAELLDLSDMNFDRNGPWWMRCSQLETIILG